MNITLISFEVQAVTPEEESPHVSLRGSLQSKHAGIKQQRRMIYIYNNADICNISICQRKLCLCMNEKVLPVSMMLLKTGTHTHSHTPPQRWSVLPQLYLPTVAQSRSAAPYRVACHSLSFNHTVRRAGTHGTCHLTLHSSEGSFSK